MTENDGQIGLADVELRGFIYTKTHRQDDSGSHRLELGWIRVCSLAPNSFYRVSVYTFLSIYFSIVLHVIYKDCY